MDPTELLKTMRSLALEILAQGADRDTPATELAESVQYLDGHMVAGGFLPNQWGERRVSANYRAAGSGKTPTRRI